MLKLKFLQRFFNKTITKTDTGPEIKTPAITPTEISDLLHQDPTMCLWYDCVINRINTTQFDGAMVDYTPYLVRSAIYEINTDPAFSAFRPIAIAIYTIPPSRHLGFGRAHPIIAANNSTAPVFQLITQDKSDQTMHVSAPIGMNEYINRTTMGCNLLDDISLNIITDDRMRRQLAPTRQR